MALLTSLSGCGGQASTHPPDSHSGGNNGVSSGGSNDSGNGGGGESSGGETSTNSGGALGSGGTTGTGGTSSASGPCFDTDCSGACEGSCSEGFTCNTAVQNCSFDLSVYCGCDGTEFSGSSTCPQRAYAHRGSCSEPFDCNPSRILCENIQPPPPCPEGQVYSVVDGCHGDCVPIGSCACSNADDCPDPNGTDPYTCIQSTGRCSYWLR